MIVDARRWERRETFLRLKELFAKENGECLHITVIKEQIEDAKQVMAFASMSGFKTEIMIEGAHYCVVIKGSSCGCFR